MPVLLKPKSKNKGSASVDLKALGTICLLCIDIHFQEKWNCPHKVLWGTDKQQKKRENYMFSARIIQERHKVYLVCISVVNNGLQCWSFLQVPSCLQKEKQKQLYIREIIPHFWKWAHSISYPEKDEKIANTCICAKLQPGIYRNTGNRGKQLALFCQKVMKSA